MKNADTSSTLNSYSFSNVLSYYFGNIGGVIEMQRFTDEEGKYFDKFYDAVGNLRREVKYLDAPAGIEDPTVSVITDYKYDSLYRVTQVRTPNGLNITYSYDGYSRQSKRTTPDAGRTDFYYDKNNNLIFSQDANQRNINNLKYTFRNYDGLNRLTGIGESILQISDNPDDGVQIQPTTPGEYLTVNVYDTISPSIVNNFFTGVSGYAASLNYTKGNVAATAYRTINTDPWNFKYFRYDVRGRVIKMWNILAGFDTLITEYSYNSQDQVINYTHFGLGNGKSYTNVYDYAGRLEQAMWNITSPDSPNYESVELTKYMYNENSQVSQQLLHDETIKNNFYYTNRNWISEMINSGGMFEYTNVYFKNGNVKSQALGGNYNNDFYNSSDLTFNYTYNKSNRLLKSSRAGGKSYEVENTYDSAGNITSLKRYDSQANILDNYTYSYYSGLTSSEKFWAALTSTLMIQLEI